MDRIRKSLSSSTAAQHQTVMDQDASCAPGRRLRSRAVEPQGAAVEVGRAPPPLAKVKQTLLKVKSGFGL